MNVLGRLTDRPTLEDLLNVYGEIEKSARGIKRNYSLDLFDTKPFADLIFAGSEAAQRYVPALGG
jgi:hypothetical protein